VRELDADLLKIDGSIVQGLPDDPLDRTVIAALASIAEVTGKRTVAEWVENLDTLRVLHECGVDFAQGNAIGRPRLQLLPQAPSQVTGEARAPERGEAIALRGADSDKVVPLIPAARR